MIYYASGPSVTHRNPYTRTRHCLSGACAAVCLGLFSYLFMFSVCCFVRERLMRPSIAPYNTMLHPPCRRLVAVRSGRASSFAGATSYEGVLGDAGLFAGWGVPVTEFQISTRSQTDTKVTTDGLPVKQSQNSAYSRN